MKLNSTAAAAVLAIFLLVLWFFSPVLVGFWSNQLGQDPQLLSQNGSFGDSFGTFNSLATTLAMIFAALAFWSQREELRLQRAEFSVQSTAMKQQAAALTSQLAESEASRVVSIISTQVQAHIANFEAKSREYETALGLCPEGRGLDISDIEVKMGLESGAWDGWKHKNLLETLRSFNEAFQTMHAAVSKLDVYTEPVGRRPQMVSED